MSAKFAVGDPAAGFDGDAARPDDAATTPDTAQRDDKERGEKCRERNGLLDFLLLRRFSHLQSLRRRRRPHRPWMAGPVSDGREAVRRLSG